MRTRTHQLHLIVSAVAAFSLLCGVLTACGDDDTTDDAAPATQETATTEEAPTPEQEPDPTTTTTTEPAGEYAELVVDYCESFGRLDEPGALDELMGMMTDDVVLTDTVLGASLTGTEQVRDYLTSELFAGIDTALCGAAVHRGDWYAGTYSLGGSAAGTGAVGITAMHLTDGKIDQHISYYTPDQELVAPSSESIETSEVVTYCNAWDDGGDPDAVMAFLAPTAELHFGDVVIEGAAAIGEFVTTTFDFDQNDCGTAVVEHGVWVAGDNTFSNTETGAVHEGVDVVQVDQDGKIVEHYAHLEASAEASVAG